MAGIIYNVPGAGSVNPNPEFIPVNIGGSFVDSSWTQNNDFYNTTRVQTVDQNGNGYGFQFLPLEQLMAVGDFDALGNTTVITVDDSAGLMNFNANLGFGFVASDPGSIMSINAANFIVGTKSIRLNGTLTAGSAGAASGQFLLIEVNGTTYKLNLLNF